ncbi:protein dispatched homolog 1-like isoform X2 [Littorina saxatilis]|uniref:protein dispatched homolog 1-like isoform X2 n=1 Tax=Littorina saxatilis TaxID=31220 RepID=UPI0038B42CCC
MSGKVHALEQAPTSTSLFTASAHKTHNNGIIPLGMDNHDYVNKQHDVISTSSQNGGVLRKEGAATPSSVSPVESKDAPCDGETEDDETKEPLALCKFFVQRYKLAFGVTLGLHVFLLLLTGVLIAASIDVIVLKFDGVPLQLLDHPTYLRALAWQYKDEDSLAMGKDTDVQTIGERSSVADNLLLYYQYQGNVFTKERLKEMQKVEKKLLAVPEYQKFCQLPPKSSGGRSNCVKPLSILRFFDGSYNSSLNDSSFSDVAGTLYSASQNPLLNQALQFHLGKDAVVSQGEVRSSVTRTLFYLGYPLVGYDLRSENKSTQLEKIRTFEEDHFLPILKDAMDDGAGDMAFLFTSVQLMTAALLKQVIFDMLLAAGSLCFIFLFMLLMTRSLFITGFGIFSILSSFFIANLIYRFVCQYRYFGIFHVLSIFIILGIGADNVFVFIDTWRATEHSNFPTLEHRLTACYRRAASATLYTSLTTMAAFLSNALSPLIAIQSFGLFSGILVFVNYMSVVIFFPTVIVMNHNHFEHWTWPCFRCRDKNSQEIPAKMENEHPIVRFFRGPFYKLLTHRIIRFALLAVCAALIVMFSVFAARIEPDEQSIQYYQDNHHYSKAGDLQKYGFKPSAQDDVIEVYIVYGLKNQDLQECSNTDFACTGRTVWDDGFDLNPKRAQSALVDFCARLQNLSDADVERLKIRRNAVTNRLETQCFVERINEYMETESKNTTKYPMSPSDLTLPTTEVKVNALVHGNIDTYNLTAVSPLFYRYFETVLGYWLHDGYKQETGYNDFRVYSDLLGEGTDKFDTRPVASRPDILWGTKLLYAAVVVKTTLKFGTFSFDDGLPIVKAWDDFIQEESNSMPSTLSGMSQCTPTGGNPWHFLNVQKELVDTATQGISVGIVLAFVVITLATKNVITGLLATLNIGVVTLSVVGLIPMAGWKLGVLESLNLSLVVGLAVDYVVHLAEGYHASAAQDRLTRTHDMLEHVGVSVLSGALTTLGASVFMCAAVILFFLQFGIFMFATIGFSLFYSLFGFSVLMGLLGPQGQTGSLVPVFRWLRFRLRGKKSHHEHCEKCEGRGFHDAESLPQDVGRSFEKLVV